MSVVGPALKYPPVQPVEPFTAEDDTGKIFKTYPGHNVFLQGDKYINLVVDNLLIRQVSSYKK